MKTTPFWPTAWAVLRKDLRAELRSKELVGVMLLFALLAVLIFSFALELDQVVSREAVSGVLWVIVVFASILGLNRSMSAEREQGSMDALLIAPIQRGAIFLGKFLGNLLFTLLVGVVLLPLMTVLYDVVTLNPWVLLMLTLGTWGVCASGTLLAAMTAQTRARESLLPIAMLPVVLPLLLASVSATSGILNGAPDNEWQGWIGVVLVIDVAYTVICFLLFDFVLEE